MKVSTADMKNIYYCASYNNNNNKKWKMLGC